MVVDETQTADGLARGRWPSVNMPCRVGSTPQIQFDSIDSIEKFFCLLGLLQVDWVELPSPQIGNTFVVILFSTNREQTQFDS